MEKSKLVTPYYIAALILGSIVGLALCAGFIYFFPPDCKPGGENKMIVEGKMPFLEGEKKGSVSQVRAIKLENVKLYSSELTGCWLNFDIPHLHDNGYVTLPKEWCKGM